MQQSSPSNDRAWPRGQGGIGLTSRRRERGRNTSGLFGHDYKSPAVTRDLALFNIAIDSKLRGCDVVGLKVEDVAPHGYTMDRATIRQQKTGRPVRFEITEQRVRGFRKHHDITTHRDGEWAERGEITLDAAAEIIGVCKMTALRMLRRGDLKGRQVCVGAPWVIKVVDVSAFATRKRSSSPVTPNPAQQTFEFQ
jgi:integrase